ncbi:hypothetical protein [Aestuariivivens sediminicola]|uniref:hypothetical protein n=1 Tax=Aestuariivivens sediminicola TaxID=2913560 RepID=UPI001F591D85|nr:hypothetical protein [Aestuariivivens sediminicola]
MNKSDFTYLLQHPQSITFHQTEELKSLIDAVPYMQPARAVYLKGLKDQSSLNYNQELKKTAAYTTDRSILFDYITSETFIQNEISHFIKQNSEHLKEIEVTAEDLSVSKSVAIDELLKKQIQETQGVLDPSLFEPKDVRPKKLETFSLDESQPIESVNEEHHSQEITAEDLLNLGEPLVFDKSETHSFNEWLKLTSFKPIDRSKDLKKPLSATQDTSRLTDKAKSKKFELIDKFITENPKINPSATTSSKGNLAKAQMIKPEALMTETLARIYVEQKNFKKAIQSYKILSLKYPEKSSFFANQIKAVEQLQEQNKKE